MLGAEPDEPQGYECLQPLFLVRDWYWYWLGTRDVFGMHVS